MSSERAKEALGWVPKTSFNEGLKKYIDWYIQCERKREEYWEKSNDIIEGIE